MILVETEDMRYRNTCTCMLPLVRDYRVLSLEFENLPITYDYAKYDK